MNFSTIEMIFLAFFAGLAVGFGAFALWTSWIAKRDGWDEPYDFEDYGDDLEEWEDDPDDRDDGHE